MALITTFEDFAKGYEAGENQVVYARLAADLDTPVSLMLKLTGAQKDAFMLESVTGGEVRGRYSIIGMKPDLIWQCHGKTSRLNRQARFDQDAFVDQAGDPLANLRSLIAESRIDLPDDLPQAAAGLFGYLGYDMIRLVEHLPNVNPDPLGLPDACMMRPSVVAVLDGVKGDVTIVAPAWVADGQSAKAAYAQAAERVMDAMRDLERAMPQASRDLGSEAETGNTVSNFTKAGYMAAVEKAKDYIRAGDIFQVVPAQRWTQDFPQPPFALYRSLRRTNPSPFMFYFNFGPYQVVGASPEILVRVFGNEVTIRPIAGTRPRGATPDEDRANEADLLADKKELAEHLMLLDLGRNDVGRVAEYNTVEISDVMVIERYSHVMHITSNVNGQLREDCDSFDALAACLPAGTVSGAPKVRAMEIIDELEPNRRGPYAGAVGYIDFAGNMDTCIALRTVVIHNDTAYVQAGAGIVADSVPTTEYQETLNKARGLLKAIEITKGRLAEQ